MRNMGKINHMTSIKMRYKKRNYQHNKTVSIFLIESHIPHFVFQLYQVIIYTIFIRRIQSMLFLVLENGNVKHALHSVLLLSRGIYVGKKETSGRHALRKTNTIVILLVQYLRSGLNNTFKIRVVRRVTLLFRLKYCQCNL